MNGDSRYDTIANDETAVRKYLVRKIDPEVLGKRFSREVKDA